jgi:hypothetical protein
MRRSIVRKNWLNHVTNLYNPLLSKPVSPFYRIAGFGKRNDDNDKLWSLEVLDKNSLVQIRGYFHLPQLELKFWYNS